MEIKNFISDLNILVIGSGLNFPIFNEIIQHNLFLEEEYVRKKIELELEIKESEIKCIDKLNLIIEDLMASEINCSSFIPNLIHSNFEKQQNKLRQKYHNKIGNNFHKSNKYRK